MNNKGKGQLLIGIGVFAVIALLAVMVYYVAVKETTYPGTTQTITTGEGAGTIVTTNPIISIIGNDAQQSGTAVSTSGSKYQVNKGGFNSVTLGTTTAIPGQIVDLLLVNNSNYHNAVLKDISVNVDSFPVGVKFNKNASVIENLYTTTGLVITTGGGAQNQTDLGNGATYNLKDEMTAGSLTETQDMICIVEITAGSNASTTAGAVTYGGKAPVSTSKPTWYSTAGTTSNVYQFEMPSLKSSNTVTNTLHLEAKSSGRFSATSYVKKSCYTKEWFVDDVTGVLTFDVADSNGNLKSMAIYTYTAYFQ